MGTVRRASREDVGKRSAEPREVGRWASVEASRIQGMVVSSFPVT
jgi:hypothetical protein